jgi:hypothetical protein
MLSSSILKPGDKGTIRTTVTTAGLAGPLSKTVQVLSNDPQRPVVKLMLKAHVTQAPPKTP